jgi:hypothetical protein
MPEDERDIEERCEDDDLIERALCAGVRDALRQHKLAGNPRSPSGKTARWSGFSLRTST